MEWWSLFNECVDDLATVMQQGGLDDPHLDVVQNLYYLCGLNDDALLWGFRNAASMLGLTC